MAQRLTPKQQEQLRQLKLSETPEVATSQIVRDLTANPTLWELLECFPEERMFDQTGEISDSATEPGLALYIAASGEHNGALMQLALYWGARTVGWVTERADGKKRILRCWWETAEVGVALPN
jgi:hypothetical protein